MPVNASQEWKKILDELRANIKAKDLEVAKREEDLKVSQQKSIALTHAMAEIREEMKSAQRRIEQLLKEKYALERDLKLSEAEIDVLKLKNSSIVTIKELEIAEYQKQVESVRQELEVERKRVCPLQEELQRKRAEVAEKMKDIQYLTEARDRANYELEKERQKAEEKSIQLTVAALSRPLAVCTMEFQVCVSYNLICCSPCSPLCIIHLEIA